MPGQGQTLSERTNLLFNPPPYVFVLGQSKVPTATARIYVRRAERLECFLNIFSYTGYPIFLFLISHHRPRFRKGEICEVMKLYLVSDVFR